MLDGLRCERKASPAGAGAPGRSVDGGGWLDVRCEEGGGGAMGWRRALDALWGVWLPEACAACDEVLAEGPWEFCPGCRELVLELASRRCSRCGEPGAFAGGLCPRCRRRPPPFLEAWAAFEHEGAVARAVHRFKYGDRSDLARPLAQALARLLPAHLGAPGRTLVPVPLHAARFRERRYDQAALLATALAHTLGARVRPGWLTRVRDTPRQVGLQEAQREANVEGAFGASAAARGQAVVLVDDVLTTGATAREATRALLEAGAREVLVVTVARARRLQLA
jgi:ComF family protein